MTNQYLWYRVAGRDPSIRAADTDREQTAERLRKGHTEGRLDTAEFQERLDRCYESKTLGELRELVKDLPRQEEQPARSSFGSFRALPLVPLLIVLFVVLAAAPHHVFLLWIPLLFIFWRLSSWRRRRWAGAPRRGPDDWL